MSQLHTPYHTCTILPRTYDRGQKLKEASEQQQFLRAVEDVEQWMTDMEGQMASEDLGKDLISVNILIKKHAVCHSLHMHACMVCVKGSKDWRDEGDYCAMCTLHNRLTAFTTWFSTH